MKLNYFKPAISALCIYAAIFGIVACNPTEKPGPGPEPEPEPEPEPTPTEQVDVLIGVEEATPTYVKFVGSYITKDVELNNPKIYIYFAQGESVEIATANSVAVSKIESDSTFSVVLNSLLFDTDYTALPVLRDGDKEYVASNKNSFKTTLPQAQINGVKDISYTNATLEGEAVAVSGVELGVQVSSNSDFSNAVEAKFSVSEGLFSVKVDGLKDGAKQYCRIYAKQNGRADWYGTEVFNFETKVLPEGMKPYVDADGVDHGFGVEVDGVIWAPVNCGYSSANPYGLYYQWGRKYGQGYDGESNAPTFLDGPVSNSDGNSEANKGNFYKANEDPYDWNNSPDASLWNAGTEEAPVKAANDPCPEGWRVPTSKEMKLLTPKLNYQAPVEVDGINYGEFGGSYTLDEAPAKVVLPMGGYRDFTGAAYDQNYGGMYWSSTIQQEKVNPDYFFFGNSYIGIATYLGRAAALPVRCVKE